ncbi:uncharacterized protein RSE6_11308 [Rhynchosporium secalis]|uniref:Secreted protein n=1 Tax=Rhynchosporium secalis TaxID=38038 RepID=A0A1E1MMM8_RHYSE|nr:uncharacterized protein RSE6_11308 [Rhynchosporium secalis]
MSKSFLLLALFPRFLPAVFHTSCPHHRHRRNAISIDIYLHYLQKTTSQQFRKFPPCISCYAQHASSGAEGELGASHLGSASFSSAGLV